MAQPLPLSKRKYLANYLGRAQGKVGRLKLIELAKQYPDKVFLFIDLYIYFQFLIIRLGMLCDVMWFCGYPYEFVLMCRRTYRIFHCWFSFGLCMNLKHTFWNIHMAQYPSFLLLKLTMLSWSVIYKTCNMYLLEQS